MPKAKPKTTRKPKTTKVVRKKAKRLTNLMMLNKSPIPIRVPKTFRYDTYFTMTCPALQANTTVYFSLASLFDPDYSNVGRNKSVLFFDEIMGNTNSLYQRFKPYACDIKIKAINMTTGTFPKVVYSLTQDGSSVYPNTQSIFNIANRTGANAIDLEYSGDTAWITRKYKAKHHQIWGVSRASYNSDTSYEAVYNQASSVGPWLAITLGDGMQNAGSGAQMDVNFQLEIDYKVMIFDPVLKSAV